MTVPISPIELAEHTHAITGSSDWPMFIFMVGLMGVLFAIIQALVALLMRSYHKSMLERIEENHNIVLDRITTHRKADSEHCQECRTDHDKNKGDFRKTLIRELDALWENIKVCCAASGVAPIPMKDLGIKREDA